MGQKIHPGGFRLNTTQEHDSSWCHKNWRNYSQKLKRDYKIRTIIENNFRTNDLVQICIRQNYMLLNSLSINIYLSRSFTGIKKIGSQDLYNKIRQIEKEGSYTVNLYEIKEPSADARILAMFITNMLEKRIKCQRVIRKITTLTKGNYFVYGIKIKISGRLNGGEIAKNEWVLNGGMPLQTLRAHVSYALKTAKTNHGILGVKVWIYKGE
jgi:small subunit ribosomal protein S3